MLLIYDWHATSQGIKDTFVQIILPLALLFIVFVIIALIKGGNKD